LLEELQLRPSIITSAYHLNPNEHIYKTYASKIDPSHTSSDEKLLVYEKNGSIRVLARYTGSDRARTGQSRRQIVSLGGLYAGMLPGNRIVYLHAYHDSEITNSGANYSLTVLSLDNLEKKILTHTYSPTEIEWSPQEYSSELIEQFPNEYADALAIDAATEALIDKRKYNVPVSNLLTDNEFIFVFTYSNNQAGEILTDIFNADTGQYISSAYLPKFVAIRNGFGYTLNNYRETGDFPKIEKYKIDPRVYGR